MLAAWFALVMCCCALFHFVAAFRAINHNVRRAFHQVFCCVVSSGCALMFLAIAFL